MSQLKNIFGVPCEARSAEFYRTSRWMGQTPAEARFVRTMRVLTVCVLLLGGVFYWLQ